MIRRFRRKDAEEIAKLLKTKGIHTDIVYDHFTADLKLEGNSAEKKWSKDKIVDIILLLHKKGVSLSCKFVNQHYPGLYCSASSKRYFGSWGKAIRSTGLDYNKIKKTYKTYEEKTDKIAKAKILGHLLGDGWVGKNNMICYANSNKNLVNDFESCFKTIYNTAGCIITRNPTPFNHQIKILYLFQKMSGQIAPQLKKELKNPILKTKKEKAAFIQALFDDEGSASQGYTQLSFTQTNKKNVYRIKMYLTDLGIQSKIKKRSIVFHSFGRVSHNCLPQYTLRVCGQRNVKQYRKLIGFLSKEKQQKLDEYCNNVGQAHYPYPQKIKRKTIKLRKKRLSSNSIAKILGINGRLVRDWTKSLGIKSYKCHPEKIKRKAEQMRKKRFSAKKISAVLHVHPVTIAYWTKHLHINANAYPQQMRETAIKLRKKGWFYIKIAKKLKINKGTAFTWTKNVKKQITSP